jgi:hypothetical protein
MKRWLAAVSAGLLLTVAFGATPASAELLCSIDIGPYGSAEVVRDCDQGSGTDTTVPDIDFDLFLDRLRGNGPSLSNSNPAPGDAVDIGNLNFTIDESVPATAVLAGDTDIAVEVTFKTDSSGDPVPSVKVPADTPPGVYAITVSVTDSLGRERALVIPVVVQETPRVTPISIPTRRFSPGLFTTTQLPFEVPTAVRELLASVNELGGAEAVMAAVAQDDATLVIDNGQLVLKTSPLPTPESTSSRPMVAALAIALGGAGLVSLRRRTPSISKRSN